MDSRRARSPVPVDEDLSGAPILGIWYWCIDPVIVQRVLSAKGTRTRTIFALLVVMDAVRRQIEGVKLRRLLERWITESPAA
jgi:uncharacterized sodium:solute symporter family permease YidK